MCYILASSYNTLCQYSHQSPASNPSRHLSSVDDRLVVASHTIGSLLDPTSSPGSLSIDHTPIPSPQPSFASSQRSARSSGRGSSRKQQRNYSPGHMSSGSEDTIKVCAPQWARKNSQVALRPVINFQSWLPIILSSKSSLRYSVMWMYVLFTDCVDAVV